MSLATLVAAAALVGVRGAVAGGASGRFEPLSLTFVSSRLGWVLGSEACGRRRCAGLLQTRTGGTSWRPRALPAALARLGATSAGSPAGLNVRFADPRDGWIYGDVPEGGTLRPVLWTTHDGGTSWRPLTLGWLGRDDSILDLEASAGTAYLLSTTRSGHAIVAHSPVSADRWQRSRQTPLPPPAGGAQQTGAFVFAHGRGWLVEGNDRGVTGSARHAASGAWVPWPSPCREVGDSYTVPAASGNELAAVCVMGGFASPLTSAAPRGATLGSSWLYVSHDGGRRFAAATELGRRGSSFGWLAEPAPGHLLVAKSSGGDRTLEESLDGGRRWVTVLRGAVAYLGFTTPTQGVVITEAQGERMSDLWMSFDGGRSWKRIDLTG